ncbi:MAG TPA: 2-C-methyl-D-erythritol 4-phosphate cytidylyltransferase [Chthoniobacterales bacterium]|nr:2-C-methyl-D-erythritol 4-phosphate cytidylyltransferase [Chthoniobacterales bacterium]
MLTAIIVAGGSGRRMGLDKTFAVVANKPAIAHAIAAFEAAPSVAAIIVVGRAARMEALRELVVQEQFLKVRDLCAGGAERQDSVGQGLQRLPAETTYVAVHDAARLLITPAQIERVFEQARRTGAAALASPVRDTLKQADANGLVTGAIPREGVYAMETPQIFERTLLIRAYENVRAQQLSITDEVSAIALLKEKVTVVPNESLNFKITFPADLQLAEIILQARARTS